MEKKTCPSVRFKIFNDAWGERNLANEVSFYSGLTYSPNDITNKSGTLVLRSSNVKNGEITLLDNVYVCPEVAYSQNVDIGDIIVVVRNGSRSLIGKHATIKKNMINTVIGAFMTGVKSSQPDFINALFDSNNFINQVNRNLGATINQITIGAFKEMSFNFPTVKEKTQIGHFFQNLDQSIALKEKKLAQTQNLKKAMLEKMFPKVGSKQPEIRLKGFFEKWEAINLGSLCQIGDIDHRMPESTKSGIPYLMTGDFFGINGLDFENAKLISNEDYEQLSKKIKPEIGDILFARYASVGTVRLVVTDIKFLISYSCAILKTSFKSNGEYLFYWFQTAFAQNQIDQEINTGSQRNIGIDSLKKLSVTLPKANEQKAIASFFKKLDETLALQQQQLQTLKNLKQAFLEKMFV